MRLSLQNEVKDERSESRATFPTSRWRLLDIVIVLGIVLVGTAVFYTTLIILYGDGKGTFRISRYVAAILMSLLPIWWVRRRYGLKYEFLGIRQGRIHPLFGLVLGAVTGVAYSTVVQFTAWKWPSPPPGFVLESFTSVVFILLSHSGFVTIVLTPIGEEILFRGFVYDWLRRRIGVIGGLLIQACLFSLLHIDFALGAGFANIGSRFLIGLLLGVLYETTASLFPAMVCHGTINYMMLINMATPLFFWID